MGDWPILSTITFFPLVGAFIIFLVKDEGEQARRNILNVALFTTIVVFLLSLLILYKFDKSVAGFQMEERLTWLGHGMNYHMGIDGLSVLFIVLSGFLFPFCILTSWESIQKKLKYYMIAFLVLETTVMGVFSSLNSILFYVFYEGSLIPMFIIVGVWGGANKVYANYKFFLYTLAGSIFIFIAFMVMYRVSGTLDVSDWLDFKFAHDLQTYLWLAFFASFAVKMPMWPVHTWLRDAHVEAPTAGSVILAGIMLKFAGYGFLRFSLPMFPDPSAYFSDMIFILSIIAIIYTSLVALVQTDIKRLVAYSSIAHMGYVTMGIFTGTEQAIQGAIFQMLSHGLISGALFLCIGVLYDRMHTREIAAFGGVVKNMPKLACVFLILSLANAGLPGTSGFVGEFLTLLGTFKVNTSIALIATSGVILSAAYTLYLYKRVFLGVPEKESVKALVDISLREKIILYPMVILIIFFGVYPKPIFEVTEVAVKAFIHQLH